VHAHACVWTARARHYQVARVSRAREHASVPVVTVRPCARTCAASVIPPKAAVFDIVQII